MGMYCELKENKVHGTREFPYVDYHIRGVDHAFQIPVHWHDEMEIIYVRQGPLKVSIEGREFDAEEGDIYIVNPGELHFMGSRKTGADYHSVVFPLELISFRSEDELENRFFFPLRAGKLKFQNVVPEELKTNEMFELLQELTRVYRTEGKERQLQIRVLLLHFIELLQKDAMVKEEWDDKSNLGKDILIYLGQNYTSPLRLSDIAEELHLSEKYISRYFKQSFHMNISQYVSHLRITKARELLRMTNLPVTEVAFGAGFQDVSYFVRTFHKQVGISPLQYRKQGGLDI